jgi:C4-dicarboxylate-specific signal transduction histidine kinase
MAGGMPRRLAVILVGEENRILVVDTGPGISEEAANHVFEPFFTMRAGGKGLGLHISSELMRNLHGRLRLASPDDSHLIPPWASGAAVVAEFDPSVRADGCAEGEDRGA